MPAVMTPDVAISHEGSKTLPIRRDVWIPIESASLRGDLAIPDDAVGLVVFAHGGGDSRHGARNRRLAHRLFGVVEWCRKDDETRPLPLGLFGASTGGAAALVAAAEPLWAARSVVLRGGRPDLAGEALKNVRVPTLLIVGGEDEWVLQRNVEAYGTLTCKKEHKTVPGASHLFEEPGALEQVARHAAAWFDRTLAKA